MAFDHFCISDTKLFHQSFKELSLTLPTIQLLECLSDSWEDANEYARKNQSAEKGDAKKEKGKRKVKKHGKDKPKKTEKDYSLDYNVDIIYQVPKVSNEQVPTEHVKKDKWEHTLKMKNGAHY